DGIRGRTVTGVQTCALPISHPFFPASFSLGSRLLRELDLFDAIEFSHFYTRHLDFNRRAVALARETGLPLVGSSDSHLPHQLGKIGRASCRERAMDALGGAR